MKANSLRGVLLASCAYVGCTSPAFAQAGTADGQLVDAPAEDVRSDAVEEDGQSIVVTGSRTITNGNNSPTPVTVVAVQELAQTTPSNVPDGLNKLPQFGNSSNQSQTSGTASSNSVGNYLNIRGIGQVRTLVLFDGRRLPSTATGGQIDTNIIPQLLLDRVDVVTGGASAVYGSDAVSGVVNFVINKKFNGIKANAQAGVSTYGDAGSQRLGLAAGTPFAGGRGHIEASYEFYNSAAINSRSARPIGREIWGLQGGGTAANPFHLVPGVRYGNRSFDGYILSGPRFDYNFRPDGSIVPFVHGAPTGTPNIEQGGDGAYLDTAMTSSLRTHQGFARLDYELTDDVQFFAQGAIADVHSSYDFAPPNIFGYTYTTDNAFLRPEVAAQLSTGGATQFSIAKWFTNHVYEIVQDTRSHWGTLGFDGSLGDSFKWNVSYTHSQAVQRGEITQNINVARFLAASDAVRDSSNNIVCRVSMTNPGLYPGCVPLNVFGSGSDSDAAWDYVTDPTYNRLTNKMDDFLVSISGSPFDTWAGPVQIALSGEYRSLSLRNVSNAEPSDVPDCTGLRFNCGPTTLPYRGNIVAGSAGSQKVTEGAFEINVPLLRDVPLISEFNVNAAVRYADYDTTGGTTTWKVGLDWHVSDDLRLRATRSRDIRAPNINELFAPQNITPSGFADLHTGVTQSTLLVSQGNTNLEPEVANTLTLGAVYRPNWLPRFSLSVDYYRIKIKNAITTVSPGDAAVQKLCEESNGTSVLCSLMERPLPFSDRTVANYPTRVFAQPVNIALFDQEGIDFELGYQAPIGPGKLSLRALAAYTIRQDTQTLQNAPLVKWAGVGGNPLPAGGMGIPKLKITAMAQYATDLGSLTIQQRWRSKLALNGDPTLVYSDPPLPATGYTDVTLAITPFGKSFEFFVSVENLFNNQPDPFTVNAYSSVPGYSLPAATGDDIMGRYFTSGVRLKF